MVRPVMRCQASQGLLSMNVLAQELVQFSYLIGGQLQAIDALFVADGVDSQLPFGLAGILEGESRGRWIQAITSPSMKSVRRSVRARVAARRAARLRRSFLLSVDSNRIVQSHSPR